MVLLVHPQAVCWTKGVNGKIPHSPLPAAVITPAEDQNVRLADNCFACRLPLVAQVCTVSLRQSEWGLLPTGRSLATPLLKEYGELLVAL